MAGLAERMGISSMRYLGGDPISLARPLMMDDGGYDYSGRDGNEKGYDMAGSVAVIPIHGTLVQKLGTLRPYSGMTGYDGIRQAFLTALYDPKVECYRPGRGFARRRGGRVFRPGRYDLQRPGR